MSRSIKKGPFVDTHLLAKVAKGRGDRILKRNSHITIRVGDE